MSDVTEEQRANLTKLAAYLRTLPVEYPDFAMDTFTKDARWRGFDYAHVPECGTAACAAGHGPAAGIDPISGESWVFYSRRAFTNNHRVWSWLFSSEWEYADNTAHGAAARMEWFLANGLPEDATRQRRGEAPLCYTPASVPAA